ncbi:hypothetical protein [Mycolicibacterium sphagni]|uniref:Intersectin-EH binding protein Ibp1 n=1 Tax=Mycolicibacterium sphagni TaxID=1786 RepID=A0A255DTG4_9MYCO|nr:hypothetical protein [Mycolicibacterium sphagni]MCV7174299.1 hypothetical protein [Mycolicibacterium sphagni]OYN78943.1 hypothetical protein CG716_13845 [Mycolicibacterium sphagni]
MSVRVGISRALLAVACGGLFVAGPVVAAAPAGACPIGHSSDPMTGQCFVTNGGVPSVGGIPCIPGKSVGTCLGILQNQSPPGGGPPVGGPWP